MTHVMKAGRHLRKQMSPWAIALLAVITAVAFTIPFLLADPALGDHPTSAVTPTVVSGNPDCTDVDIDFDHEEKIEPVEDGEFFFDLDGDGVNDGSITLDVDENAKTFDFTITGAVANAVLVKGGPNANLYDYITDLGFGVSSDVDLHAPRQPNGNLFGLSHISFCLAEAQADVSVEKTPDGGTANAGDDITFTVTVTSNGPGTAENVTLSDNLPNTGLNWTETSDPSGSCSVSGAVGSQVLTCNFGDLASGQMRTVSVTSPTSADNCGLIGNTASVDADNDSDPNNNSDDGDITVECAAIRILKNSTKGGAVTTAGAVFSYDSASVTDNGTGDEDSDIGEVCVSGLVPGTYTVNETTPPAGYGGASETDVAVEAVAGTDCGDNQPSGTGEVAFTNAPQFDIQVNFRDGGSTETSIVSITCDGNTAIDGDPATGWDTSQTTEDIEFVDEGGGEMTIECTLVVDP